MNSILEEEKEDLFGRLSDDVLCQIILFLPFKCAVQTSIFSTRWRPLWKKALALHGTIEDLPKVITAFLNCSNEPHLVSSIRGLPYHFGENSTLLATITNNTEVHLDFTDGEEEENPKQFDWKLKLHDETTTIHRSSIETLQLTSVNKLTKEHVSSIASNFPLTSLEIAKCKDLQALRILANSELQSFTILDCPELNDFFLVSYNIRRFRFRGVLPLFSLMHGPFLQDAMLDFREGPGNHPFSRENLLSLLLAVSKVEVLTLCGWPFQVPIHMWLPLAGFFQDPKDFMFYNLKELRWIDSSMEEYKMHVLVSFLKICPLLERLCITLDPSSYRNPNREESHIWVENANQEERNRRLSRLRVVKMEGFINQEDEILLAKCLLRSVVSVEPDIIATSNASGSNSNLLRRLVKINWTETSQNQLNIEQNISRGESASSSSRDYQKEAVEEYPEIYDFEFVEEEKEEELCATFSHIDV